MFVNPGNAFDEAVYQYGLVKGTAFASQLDEKAVKKFLHDRVEQFIDSIVEEIANAAFDDAALANIYSQAENAWDCYRSGIYNGIQAIINPTSFAAKLQLCGESY